MRYICDNCRAIHIDKDFIYVCAKCEKEVCVECTDEEYDVDGESVCADCYDESQTYKYPQDFFDFNNGVDIKESEIKKWLSEVKVNLQMSDEEYDWSCCGSGNTFVFGTKTPDEYDFFVAKGYKQLTVDAEDIRDVEF